MKMTARTLGAALKMLPPDTEIVLADMAEAVLEVTNLGGKLFAVITDRVEEEEQDDDSCTPAES